MTGASHGDVLVPLICLGVTVGNHFTIFRTIYMSWVLTTVATMMRKTSRHRFSQANIYNGHPIELHTNVFAVYHGNHLPLCGKALEFSHKTCCPQDLGLVTNT
jgi:hypothetical protein